jgi:hypothetical protein
MILFTAVRIDVNGRCQFTIEADGTQRVTSDPAKAAKILYHLGVPEPLQLVDHVQQWGAVEIVPPPPARH